jgi:hypothetical protein
MSQETRALYEEPREAPVHAMAALRAGKSAREPERIEPPELARLDAIHRNVAALLRIVPYIAMLLLGILVCVGVIAYRLSG